MGDYDPHYHVCLHTWLMGPVGHDAHFADVCLPFLQAECGFDSGDLTVITIYSFGTLSHWFESASTPLRGLGRWTVRDAKLGLVAEGRQSSRAVATLIRRPSDWLEVDHGTTAKKVR